MVQLLFTLSSHMFFIYVSFYLLKDLVSDNTRKVRLLVAFFSIVIGYILSSFFISLYHLWQEALRGLL
ncbi:DUF1146 domain-containing protein [Streptococcus pneumoniae]|nr:DUF1146 domain-containing protein [Streptococcus pneumoniae]